MNNPFFDELKQFKFFQSIEDHRTQTYDNAETFEWNIETFYDEMKVTSHRERLKEKYSYAIPNAEAIKVICHHSPIMEIGSGTGYWSNLISQEGGEIIAIEHAEESKGYFKPENIGKHHPVKIIEKHNDEILSVPDLFTLFICWPPYDTSMAYKYLKAYKGNTFIYIGESRGGCTANESFFNLLDQKWCLERTVSIPQFPSIHDYLAVYRRIS